MPKSSRSVLTSNAASNRSSENTFPTDRLKTLAVAVGMLLLAAPAPSFAGDWIEDKSVTETFDLTAVPSLNALNGKNSNGATNAATSTGSNQNPPRKHSPYMMLSTPSTGSSTSTSRSTRSASAPAASPSKTKEYDLEISEEDSTRNAPAARKRNILSRVAGGPAKAIGVTCGVMVGVPVSIARDTRKYTGQMKKSMNDGFAVEKSGDLAGHFWASAAAVPFGIGSGLVHGSVTGFQRAIEHGKTEPFSKESMSLGSQSKSLSNRPVGAGNN